MIPEHHHRNCELNTQAKWSKISNGREISICITIGCYTFAMQTFHLAKMCGFPIGTNLTMHTVEYLHRKWRHHFFSHLSHLLSTNQFMIYGFYSNRCSLQYSRQWDELKKIINVFLRDFLLIIHHHFRVYSMIIKVWCFWTFRRRILELMLLTCPYIFEEQLENTD